MNRRKFLAASALPIFSLSACTSVTRSLYRNANEKEYREYTENVSQMLMSSDGAKIVVLGQAYHYVFDAPPGLMDMLNSPLHSKLAAQVYPFSVKSDGAITGRFSLYFSGEINREDQWIAQALGFSDGEKGGMDRLFSLSGKRYSAQGFTMPPSLAKAFNKNYSVRVDEELPSGGKRALMLLTPLTVAADGVLTILSIPLLPTGIPVFASMYMEWHGKHDGTY